MGCLQKYEIKLSKDDTLSWYIRILRNSVASSISIIRLHRNVTLFLVHSMTMLSKVFLAFVGFSLRCQAYPSQPSFYGSSELGRRDVGQIPEWTGMGDSYASGVGAGDQPEDDTNRCFRFPNAYPVVMQAELKPVPSKFNNVACSGNTFTQIKEKELLDKPEDDGKNGRRPAWGEAPEFVTITMGGNDIGILNLILTCILSFKL